ncbi:unnamed protein product [Linum tenue]|uniref:S-protein homolog n=1 Tax=Linum tenue TaxID=586396 RepID=A0AAV0GWD9_9ROSI|nr:unnamed protein product [Linum tenue]
MLNSSMRIRSTILILNVIFMLTIGTMDGIVEANHKVDRIFPVFVKRTVVITNTLKVQLKVHCSNGLHWYDIYDDTINYNDPSTNRWLIKAFGPCMWDKYTSLYDICDYWQK